ncbi:MAG: DUF2130 domain-containing protein [Candidatus Dadabacteria bacterium]|nr:DUF2130 domain-containing protein [Candidatus Dadabacteria bacterium]
MIEPTIICPNCSTEIKLTESLAAPLIEATKDEYERKLKEQEDTVAKREADIRQQQEHIERDKQQIEDKVAERLKAERIAISEEEKKKARTAVADEIEGKIKEIAELQGLVSERNEKLKEAQKEQANLLKKQRELDDAKRELDLTVEKRVQESIAAVHKKAKAEAEEALSLKVSEKEQQIASMQKQIEDLRRKAEQGSQQLQGEVMELALEETLRAKFPLDRIEPVPKGEFGGDVIQSVISATGNACGSILWESKRTKNWSGRWLTKLRDDQRVAKADIAIIISQALPKDITTFGLVDGVWVTGVQFYVPLAIALRQSLIEIYNSKTASEGQRTKMELVYQYLTGPRFRHRVEAIVEKFSDMQADLDRERKSMTRLWAKREAQIQGVIESAVGMYGDLQGIAGQAIQEIEGLELPLLEDKEIEE